VLYQDIGVGECSMGLLIAGVLLLEVKVANSLREAHRRRCALPARLPEDQTRGPWRVKLLGTSACFACIALSYLRQILPYLRQILPCLR